MVIQNTVGMNKYQNVSIVLFHGVILECNDGCHIFVKERVVRSILFADTVYMIQTIHIPYCNSTTLWKVTCTLWSFVITVASFD